MKQQNFKLIWLIITVMVLAFAPKDAEADDNVPPQENGYYQISTKEQLIWFAAEVNKGGENLKLCAKLMDNITVNEDLFTKINTADGTINDGKTVESWTPIGTYDNSYTGTFDGNNHTISGLYFCDDNKERIGLIGYADTGATIQNVGVKDSYFKGAGYVGGVCGSSYDGTISNCYNTGYVSGKNANVGGVCGFNNGNGIIKNCYNTGTVSGTNQFGGVCGSNNSTIENCYNTGYVSATGSNTNVGNVCGASSGTIKYGRANLAVGNYGTICMPYAVAAGSIEGAEFYSIAGKEEKDGTVTSVYLEKVTGDLVAGQPYIFKAKAETLTCTITSTSEETKEAGSRNGLIGCFEETEVLEGDNIYVLKNNELYKRGTQPWKIAAGRAYINMKDVPIYNPQSAPANGVIKIGVSDDGTTGISAVKAEHDNGYYNLQGQRVAAPTRGIYIVNGKKVIIK